MKCLEAVINRAISDEITDSNPFKQIKPENKPKKLSTEVIDKSKRDAVDKLDVLTEQYVSKFLLIGYLL